jgi:tetratricopeptide (TPR) repeat protein
VAEGALADAIVELRALVHRVPRCAAGWYDLGLLYEHQLEYKRAIDSYEKACKSVPSSRRATLGLGRVYARLGNIDRAASALAVAMANERSGRAEYVLGRACLIEDLPARAGAMAELLMVDDAPRRRALGHTLLGEIRYADDDIEGAAGEYEAALRLNPGDLEASYYLARVQYMRRQVDRARETMAPLLREQPDSLRVAMLMAEIEYRARNGRLGDEWLARARTLQPNSPVVHTNLGEVALWRKDLTAAARHFRDALAADEYFASAYKGLGDALRPVEPLAALEHYEFALQLDPGDDEAFAAARDLCTGLGLLGRANSLARIYSLPPSG